MGNLSGYSKRKSIQITAASPSAQGDTIVFQPCDKDTRLNEAAPTTNYGSMTTFTTRPDTGSSNEQRSLLEFDISQWTPPQDGFSITTATLGLYYLGYDFNNPVGNTVWAYKLDPDNDGSTWVEAQATWNIYSTGNNWDTAGGDYLTSNPSGGSDTVPAVAAWMEFDVANIVQDAIDNESSIVKIILIQTDGATLEIPKWCSKEYASSAERPKLTIEWARTPTVPSNYKVYVNVHRGSPTVEEGTWTVNSKTYNYRVPFTVHTHEALSATYPLRVIVNTEELVIGGFFASSAASNAKSCEWVDNSSNTMKFWCTEDGEDSPDNFNTTGTIYFVQLPSGLSADTDYTMYLYIDPDQTGASSNYDASSVFTYFEHFDDNDCADLAEFLTEYTDWETDPNAAVVTVGSSVLSLDSANAAQWDGIATKSGICDIADYRMYAKVDSFGLTTAVGMFDTAGIGAGSAKSGFYFYANTTTAQFVKYKDDSATNIEGVSATAPKIIELSKFEGMYQLCTQQDSADGEPDKNGTTGGGVDLTANDEDHKIFIGSYGTNTIEIDWVAVMPEIEKPPYVIFPDILYSKNGTVFLESNSEHWPYDTAFTDDDGSTQLYWWNDPLTELTRQPGDSMQVAVRVTDSLASNQSIYVYYGNSSQSSFDAYNDPDMTFDEFDDMTAVADWTEVAGSWSVTDVIDPVLYRGDVGNVGGDAGRLWARMPCVVKWGTGDYKMIFCNVLWEKSGSNWPLPYRVYLAESTTPNGEFGAGESAFTIGELEHDALGYWPQCAKKIGSTCYILVTDGDGFKLIYTTDFSTYTQIDNDDSTGKFLTRSWVDANDGGDFDAGTAVTSFTFIYDGSTYYYVFFSGMGASGQTGYAYTTDAPENWDSSSFTYGGMLTDAGVRYEDIDIVHDTGNSQYVLAITCSVSPQLRHYTCADADFDTSMVAGDWSYDGSLNQVNPTYTGSVRSPRLLDDGSDWYLYFSSHGVDEAGGDFDEKWCPNWISCNHATSFPDTWEAQNTDSKYKQATTSGQNEAYLTSSDEYDCEVIAEVQTGNGVTNHSVGIMARYDGTNENGYAALLNYNSGDPQVHLWRIDAGTPTALGSSYDIPQFPTPWFFVGHTWRIRMRLYGENIKVAYSAWGNEWVETHDQDDDTYGSGAIGVLTNSAEGYFNNIRARSYIDTEPLVGEGVEESLRGSRGWWSK